MTSKPRLQEVTTYVSVAETRAEVEKRRPEIAELARNRIVQGEADILNYLDRSRTSRSRDVQQAEERLAIESFRNVTEWAELEKRYAGATSVSEPDVYSPHSPHSWFADVASLSNPVGATYRAAVDRLERYGRKLASNEFSPEGRRARQVWRQAARKNDDLRSASDTEFRSMTTSPASGGALVTPAYLVSDYAIFRSAAPTFADYLTTKRQLPAYGMSVSVPKFTGGGSVTATTENVAPGETDPTATYQQQTVSTYYGLVNSSAQLVDRSGPMDVDLAIYAQLRSQLDAAVDAAVIAVALAGANPITRTSASLTLPQFLADVGKAAAALETTAGTRLPPSGIAAAAGIGEWLLSQATSGGDAWFKPSLGQQRTDDGVTGQSVSGVPIYLDDNIPAASGNAQLIVANKGAVLLYESEPVLDVLPDGGLAGQLSVTFRLREYAAPVGRFSAGVSVISGSGYPASPTYI